MAKEEVELVQTPQRTRRKRVKEPMRTETILGVLAVVAVMLGILLIFSMVHAGGVGGDILFRGLYSLIGFFTLFTPLICFYTAYYLWKEEIPDIRVMTTLGVFFLLTGVAGLGEIISPESTGMLGKLFATPLTRYFAIYPSIAI